MEGIRLPGPRAAHTCDIVNDNLVIFGGWDGKSVCNTLLVFNLSKRAWIPVSIDKSVSPRNKHASCVVENTLYVHGGNDGRVWLDDTISIPLDNVDSEITVDSRRSVGDIPSARGCHTLSVLNGLVYCFGGYDGTTSYNTLSTFNPLLQSWTRIPPAGDVPPARNSHAAQTIETRGILIVHGGFGGDGVTHVSPDLFVCDTNAKHSWSRLSVCVPLPVVANHRILHCATRNPVSEHIVVFGGKNADGQLDSALWRVTLDPLSSVLRSTGTVVIPSLANVTGRHRFAVVFIPKSSSYLLVGGVDASKWMIDVVVLPSSSLLSPPLTASTPPAVPAAPDAVPRPVPQSPVAAATGTGPSRREVLAAIRLNWAVQCDEEGKVPSCRYGYVKRGDAQDLLIYGRGLEALSKPEYMQTVHKLQIAYSPIQQVWTHSEKLAQFKALQSLVLAHNGIFKLVQLAPLRHVPLLRHLIVLHNPLVRGPYPDSVFSEPPADAPEPPLERFDGDDLLASWFTASTYCDQDCSVSDLTIPKDGLLGRKNFLASLKMLLPQLETFNGVSMSSSQQGCIGYFEKINSLSTSASVWGGEEDSTLAQQREETKQAVLHALKSKEETSRFCERPQKAAQKVSNVHGAMALARRLLNMHLLDD